MYKKISDYGIIGNLHTVALIANDGSIDWLCLPHIDSPSVFGALLDDQKGGRFALAPRGEWDSVTEYVPGTNILKRRFRTVSGVMEVTDFMPIPAAVGASHDGKARSHELYRLVEVTKGTVDLEVQFEPRFDYARVSTSFERTAAGFLARSGNESLVLSCNFDLQLAGGSVNAAWSLSEGQELWLHLVYGSVDHGPVDVNRAYKALRETEQYWRDWLQRSETGRMPDLGSYRSMVERSALVLKLLFYEPAGTIAAAATTSLPEEIGGVRNWDYRYTWVRDAAFTLKALFDLGHLSETEGYIRWIERVLSKRGAGRMQIMYGLRGEEDLPEKVLTHLEGYKRSQPIRIGNEAARQRQLDIYGSLMDAALKLSDYVGKIDVQLWPFLRDVCDYVVDHWRERDSGIWEVRGGPFHFVYSKVMCWLALDRGITIANRYGFPANRERWARERSVISEEVLRKGWNDRVRSFVQHYETEALDASNLLIPLLGFLPFDDPRVLATLEATRTALGKDGFLYRYSGSDGIAGGEGAFLICTFWLIDNLIALGRLEDAEILLRETEGAANHLGLFSEEFDPEWRELLGNFPQAFTHIGYINSVIALQKAKSELHREEQKTRSIRHRFPLIGTVILNDHEPDRNIDASQIDARLKASMNVLRGAYFDTQQGRVAYERMQGSKAYAEYVKLSAALREMDLERLVSREDRLAFWINLFNVIVIHGVIALGIRDSVKEMRGFFRRICYRVGRFLFSPDDIEHGILRGNHRLPGSLCRPFRRSDPRLRFVVAPPEPRIHFALVCASSSCPPIEVYTAADIDRELTVSARTFLNGGGLVLDRRRMTVSLSRVFQWYRQDFGSSDADRLRFAAQFLYNDEDVRFIMDEANRFRVKYQDYDWRLNRS